MAESEVVKIVCSCIPGFENVALSECREKLSLDPFRDVRGRISFLININQIQKLTELRSVHHYWVVVELRENFFDHCQKNNDEIFTALAALPGQLNWEKALKTWKKFKMYKRSLNKSTGTDNRIESSEEDLSKKVEIAKLEIAEDVDKTKNRDYTNIDPNTAAENISFSCNCYTNWYP